MNTLTFAHEKLLWLLLAVPLLLLARLWLRRRESRAVQAFVAARMRPLLVTGRSAAQSWLLWSLYMVALACMIIAAARPQLGTEKTDVPDKGRNILIAIDTSRSMLAKDLVPDRLTRAKMAVHELVGELRGERIGLLAYAGMAYLQAPLTTDHEAILESLDDFDHTIIERGGSNVADLLDLTTRVAETLPQSNCVLIVFSDGGEVDDALTSAIQKMTKARVNVITVGVGTENGSLIPDPNNPTDYVRDVNGTVVQTRLNKAVLQQISSATGGMYFRLGSEPINRRAIAPILARLREQESASRVQTKPLEHFAWPLGLGVGVLIAAWALSSRPPPLPRGMDKPLPVAG
ncbi:MAG: VWA domain-containing protein [Verrucomicrobiaceae bacterium]|nr:VWA domain-containing protein [Verrucomicrobiaceae bacterium]